MEPYVTEDEDVRKLKEWWQENRGSLIFGIVLGVTVVVGYNLWTGHIEQRANQASEFFDQMSQAYEEGRIDAARDAGNQLLEGYAATPYAAKAGLLLARLQFAAGDLGAAQTHLQWVIDNSKDTAARHSARLRLARLLSQQGDAEAALGLTQIDDMGAFTSQYQELRGDLLLTKGETAAAHEAYRHAIETLPAGSRYASILQMKLDDTGEAKSE